jgi:PDZ domain-containing protein
MRCAPTARRVGRALSGACHLLPLNSGPVTRRTTTLLVTGLLIVALAAIGLAIPVPFVALQPGPTTNTLGSFDGKQLITISGDAKTYPVKGKLLLTTVSEQQNLTLISAVRLWLSSHNAVVPNELVNPSGQSEQQQQQQGQQDMQVSQDAATTAALHYLKIPETPTVATVEKGQPAFGKLQKGDILLSVNGAKVGDSVDLRADVRKVKPGGPVTIGYRRGGKDASVTLTTASSKDASGATVAVIGITLDDKRPFTVTIGLKGVGGPSAGLMFALGIIERLQPDDLTGGATIAGTGQIGDDGTVDPIGGIQQKLVAARQAGATFFLVPTENCPEASKAVPSGLRLLKVGSLATAVSDLKSIRSGDTKLAGC